MICAIPARFGSSRLPGKPLRSLAGRPMIEHVYERAKQARSVSRVVVLTDDERVAKVVRAFDGDCEMTPEDCASGTERIAWALPKWDCDAVINVQGDEPLLDPDNVEQLAEHLRNHPDDPLVTMASPAAPSDLDDPAKVKIVLDRAGHALYFSRAQIPHPQVSPALSPAQDFLESSDAEAQSGSARLGTGALRHVGIYGYQREALLHLARLEPTPLEQCEALEQLRALENGLTIRVLIVDHSGFGVDTEADLERAELLLQAEKLLCSQR